MKKVIILFTVLMTSMLAFAQQQKELARFHVTYAIYNGEDITEWDIKSKLFTVFYTVNEELYMANYSETNETQSWGVIWGLKNESIPETASDYKTDIFYFNWNYQNSYDSKKGTCKVQFIKVYKPQGVVSKLKFISETLDITEYTGYMKGTIDFGNFY